MPRPTQAQLSQLFKPQTYGLWLVVGQINESITAKPKDDVV